MTIAEISKRFGLTPDTLRYYERVGLIPRVKRTRGGIREYDEEDCRWIEFVKCMRSAGLPIEVLIEYVDLFQQGEASASARKQLLIEQRDQLAAKMEEMRKTLDRLNDKIERYQQHLVPVEHELKKR
ncbi:MAG TPA: MerR family transcriptional regulator [Clostridia bacterium]|nr:MerR family transcriptional regulator [Clostridia bacterium]